MPEVTLPVVPGMEGCHWSFRKVEKEDRLKLLKLLLEGEQVGAKDAVGWLIDFAGSSNEALQFAWKIVTGKDHGLVRRDVKEKALDEILFDIKLQAPDNPGMEAARKAIIETIRDSCGADLKDALAIQAKHSADFMISDVCRNGKIGAEFKRLMDV
jgi:enoyl-CoA hydratase/carnithine racemase